MTTPLPPRQMDEDWEARLNASLERYVGHQNNPRVQRWVERRVLMFLGESSRFAADSHPPREDVP